ncbi:MAG: heme o synthase [Planctomycetales bacterium]|nr:heme o synthase [Planctomycetales bacterium]
MSISGSTLTVDRAGCEADVAEATWLDVLADYVELTKLRISVLVLVTVAVAGYLARFGQPDLWPLLHAMLGTALVAASASALNQWLERHTDCDMARTADRPLPAGRLSPQQVVVFAAITFVVGMAWLILLAGWLPAAAGLATWFIYAWVYTPLKRRTTWNTAVGAVSGAAPVLIGWTAAGGAIDSRLGGLFLLVFLWQFPHFMAIAWLYKQQYADAGMQMMTVRDPSGRRAGVQAVLGAAALLPVCAAFGLFAPGPAGLALVGCTLLLALGQLACALSFFLRRDDDSARRLLRASLVFLPGVLLLLTFVPLV